MKKSELINLIRESYQEVIKESNNSIKEDRITTEVRQKTIDVYTFDELDKTIQKKVIDRMRETEVDSEWDSFILDEKKDELEKYGFNDIKIYYSGFGSQGDGACFIAKVHNFKPIVNSEFCKDMPKEIKRLIDDVDVTMEIKHKSNYMHSRSVTFDYSSYDNEAFIEFEDKFEKCYVSWCDALYKELDNAYDIETSDETVKSTIEANNYEFDVKGKLIESKINERKLNLKKLISESIETIADDENPTFDPKKYINTKVPAKLFGVQFGKKDFDEFAERLPKDWDVDDFVGYVQSNINLHGVIVKGSKLLDSIIKVPFNVYKDLKETGSGLNDNKNFKRFKSWTSALYDIWEAVKEDSNIL